MKQLHPDRSERRLCELLGINRSTVWRKKTGKTAKVIDLAKVKREKDLTARIHALVKTHPSWGYRRIWAWLRYRDKLLINRKRVRRIMRGALQSKAFWSAYHRSEGVGESGSASCCVAG